VILMDRENLLARGWSHVVSLENSVAELEAFRIEVGAPPPALQIDNPDWPHLDLKGYPRTLALARPGVMVFETTRELIRYVHRQRGITS
jgi:hypothetical protein